MRTPRKLADRDRERAVTLICKSIVSAPIETIRKTLCAMVGHPPLIDQCFGYVTCARCNEQLGDNLAGFTIATAGKKVIGHSPDCPHCGHVKLTPTDKLLVPENKLPVTEKVPV